MCVVISWAPLGGSTSQDVRDCASRSTADGFARVSVLAGTVPPRLAACARSGRSPSASRGMHARSGISMGTSARRAGAQEGP